MSDQSQALALTVKFIYSYVILVIVYIQEDTDVQTYNNLYCIFKAEVFVCTLSMAATKRVEGEGLISNSQEFVWIPV